MFIISVSLNINIFKLNLKMKKKSWVKKNRVIYLREKYVNEQKPHNSTYINRRITSFN